MTQPESARQAKPGLHPRNRHRERYDFVQLVQAHPALAKFVQETPAGEASIDFANPKAVKALNQALLIQFYAISEWDIPARYLCPPIPGRADYLHVIADLLAASHRGVIPTGQSIRALDIGTGANVVYPLIGHREYGWCFVGSDIDIAALDNACRIVEANDLGQMIALRHQGNPVAIFEGVVHADETFDVTLCNPPFHASLEEAASGSRRKWQNLGKAGKHGEPALNFGGQTTELYCEGGEEAFIKRMITESKAMTTRCLWFTSLVSKAATLPGVYRALKKMGAVEVRTLEMAQGQKQSRIVAWSFLSPSQQRVWRSTQPQE
jgi:23S rRNA (adenine1618-N6)-methyltransferase